VNGVSLNLPAGQTMGVVGESGSGKSSLLRAILRLVPAERGRITLDGQDWLTLRGEAFRSARQGIGVVAQNPFLSLSPRLTIASILAEPLLARGDASRTELQDRSADLLSRCGLPPDFLSRRARELSGGQAQRVAIARALALSPRLLVLDEPTSALDVSVQAQILNLLMDLKSDFGLSMLLVTHNLKAVAHVSDRLMVMRQGEVVESGTTDRVMSCPEKEYTRELIGLSRR
jgi:peptide/nickel transport system ATP-binding protein